MSENVFLKKPLAIYHLPIINDIFEAVGSSCLSELKISGNCVSEQPERKHPCVKRLLCVGAHFIRHLGKEPRD